MDSLPGTGRDVEALSRALVRTQESRDRLARALQRTTSELEELLVEVEALRRARASAETTNLVRGEILATLGRTMRGPADTIVGLMGLLRAGALLPAQRAYADSVHSAAELLLGILNDVGDFSRLEAGTLQLEPITFDLRVMVEDAAAVLSAPVQAKGLALRFAWRPDAPGRVKGDPGRIRQILHALVHDAMTRTERGEILVEVGRSSGGHGVALVVEDGGPVLPPDVVASLFEPFSRGDAYPTRNGGLPLAIARQLTRLMGGDLTAEPMEQGGIRFVALLPLAVADDEVPVAGLTAVQEPDTPSRLVVVEADPDARAAWCAIAESAGYEATGLADRHDLLEALQTSLAEQRPVGVVLASDHDADGYEALGRMIQLELASHRPAMIMLPAVGHPGDARRLRQAGFLGYLVKPVAPGDLKDVLELVRRVRPGDRHEVFLTRHALAEARYARRSDTGELEVSLDQLAIADE
ncbi:MAG TPA: ATP-binding protein [Gemmatimonadales bacterium]|nr:ATP-binding protein [Gemmatimonadales bacterium]